MKRDVIIWRLYKGLQKCGLHDDLYLTHLTSLTRLL